MCGYNTEIKIKKKRKIMGEKEIKWTLKRIASEIIEEGIENLCLIGIQKRGDVIAERIRGEIEKEAGKRLELGTLDITLYRDDLSAIGPKPIIASTEIPCNIDGIRIVLIDDVLYTGRTVRAALDELVDFGRPARIYLAVLIDRGGRELPIHPDFVGKRVEVMDNEHIQVRVKDIDREDCVWLLEESD